MSTPPGQVPPGWDDPAGPQTPSTESPAQPQAPAKSQTASIMWAIATMVVAVVGGFLIYTAITHEDGGTAAPETPAATDDAAGTAPSETTATGDDDSTQPGTTDDAATEGAATEDSTAGEESATSETPSTGQREMTEEQKEFVLALQRRDADDPMAKGDVDAPVVLIEYADYRCPFCAVWGRDVQPELQDLVDDGTLRIEFRDRVLFGEESEATALAARAAGEQGLYWEYHDAVFAAAPNSGHPDMPREKLIGFAEEIGVPDLAKFEEDMDSEELRAALQADQDEAGSLGINSTPTFLVNATPVVGAQPAEVFTQVIEQELAAAQE